MEVYSESEVFDTSVQPRQESTPQDTGHIVVDLNLSRANSRFSTHRLTPVRTECKASPVYASRVLKLPKFADDYYSNLLEWAGPLIYYAIKRKVYAYNYHTETTSEIYRTACNVTSLTYNKQQHSLVAGTSSGTIYRIDEKSHQSVAKKCLKNISNLTAKIDFFDEYFGVRDNLSSPHRSRIGVMQSMEHTIVTGSRDQKVKVFDLRSNCVEMVYNTHTQEICGLSVHGGKIASGGNDNKVCVFDVRGNRRSLFKFSDHRAAVKAVCLDGNSLYSGGGTADKTIKHYNLSLPEKQLVRSAEFGSQITNLQTIRHKNEPCIIGTFGYSDDDAKMINVSNNKFKITQRYDGHINRVIHFTMSDDKRHFATGSGDATIRIWDIEDGNDLRIR